MKRQTKIALSVLLLAVVLWWLWPERKAAPDQRLVAHMDATCEIARKNVDTPNKGVEKLFGYLGRHTPDMMEQFGALLVTIERIPDDEKHDQRARKAARRLREASRRCESDWERFFIAVEEDPKARERLERGVERFGRTLEILFGGDSRILPSWTGQLVPAR